MNDIQFQDASPMNEFSGNDTLYSSCLNACCNIFSTTFFADYQMGQSDLSLPLYRSLISLNLTELLAFQNDHLKNTLYIKYIGTI